MGHLTSGKHLHPLFLVRLELFVVVVVFGLCLWDCSFVCLLLAGAGLARRRLFVFKSEVSQSFSPCNIVLLWDMLHFSWVSNLALLNFTIEVSIHGF